MTENQVQKVKEFFDKERFDYYLQHTIHANYRARINITDYNLSHVKKEVDEISDCFIEEGEVELPQLLNTLEGVKLDIEKVIVPTKTIDYDEYRRTGEIKDIPKDGVIDLNEYIKNGVFYYFIDRSVIRNAVGEGMNFDKIKPILTQEQREVDYKNLSSYIGEIAKHFSNEKYADIVRIERGLKPLTSPHDENECIMDTMYLAFDKFSKTFHVEEKKLKESNSELWEKVSSGYIANLNDIGLAFRMCIQRYKDYCRQIEEFSK